MGYRDLEVRQRSRKLVVEIYRLTAELPTNEAFGLVSQMRRAAVSIPCNIAEGYGRRTPASYAQFLRIAKGSVNELETLLILAEDLGLMEQAAPELADLAKLGSMLSNLIQSVSESRA